MGKKIREKISKRLEIPMEVMIDLPKLTMTGDRELYLENYKRILEYTPKQIRLDLGGRQILISGADLIIDAIESRDLTVSGTIYRVEFCKM